MLETIQSLFGLATGKHRCVFDEDSGVVGLGDRVAYFQLQNAFTSMFQCSSSSKQIILITVNSQTF